MADRRQRSGRSEERGGDVLLAMPAILGFVIFTIGPMIASFVFSLTDWPIGAPRRSSASTTTHRLAHDELFWKSLTVTTYYTLGAVPLTLLVGFVVAMLVNQGVRGLVAVAHDLLPADAGAGGGQRGAVDLDLQPGLRAAQLHPAQGGLPTSNWIYSETERGAVADPDEHLGLRQHDGDLPGRAAGRAAPAVRGGRDRRRRDVGAVPARHAADDDADDLLQPGHRRDRHVPGVQPGLHHDPGRPEQRHRCSTSTTSTRRRSPRARWATPARSPGCCSWSSWSITVLLFRNARRWVYYEMGGAR